MTVKRKNTKKEKSKPVYFMDLVVKDYLCFKDSQKLDLSDGNEKPARWTIILGNNGTGKTTLLRSLLFVEPRLDVLQEPKDDSLKKYYAPIGIDSKFGIELRGLRIEASNFAIGNMNNIEKIISGYHFSFESDPNFLGMREMTQILDDISQLKIYGYGATRRVGSGSISDSFHYNISDSLFDSDVSLINGEEWLLQTAFAALNAKGKLRKELELKYEKVSSILKEILPDVFDFRIKPITKFQNKAAIQAKTHYGWVDMEDLSHGYQTIIAWMVDLAARLFERYPDSENPLAEPAIVLVDEIDLHLHPKWQRNLISHLTNIFPQIQFIVTAHSPLIVQSAENANIVLLKREGDRVKIYNNKDEDVIKGWRVDQVLTSDLFGLESTRPPQYDKYLKRKEEILNKKKLTKKDEKELVEIGKKLDELDISLGENNNDALKALQKAAGVLRSNR